MKSQSTRYRALTTCFATILLAGIVPSIAAAGAAPTVTVTKYSGLSADFSFSESSDTMYTDGYIYVTPSQGQTPGTLTVYWAEEFDFLTQNYSCYSGTVPLTTSQFQVATSLSSASLDVSGAALQDCFSGESVTADISLTWTGSGGPPTGSNNTFRTTQAGYSVRFHSTGLSRAAAVTGSLVIDGTNFLAGNPTSAFTYGDLNKVNASEVDIIKRPF
jgi:hypothetical protein